MKRPLVMTLFLCVCLLGFLTSGNAQSPAGQTAIRVKGSDDMASRVDRMAKLFIKDHPGVTILVSGRIERGRLIGSLRQELRGGHGGPPSGQ